MPNPRSDYVPPSPRERAFSCPHCNAFAQQNWYDLLGLDLSSRTPTLVTTDDAEKARQEWVNSGSNPTGLHNVASIRRLATGRPFVGSTIGSTIGGRANIVVNAFVAHCQNCTAISIWIYDQLIWPSVSTAPLPNEDLPEDIKQLYCEARAIVDKSPRGATALLRLSIQLLCKQLGQPGKNINTDIGNLVSKGLEPTVQMALDVVRVVGNNAVHPGQIDMSDNIEAATALFGLVNHIADKMITQPQRVEKIYNALPKSTRDAITKRDNDDA